MAPVMILVNASPWLPSVDFGVGHGGFCIFVASRNEGVSGCTIREKALVHVLIESMVHSGRPFCGA